MEAQCGKPRGAGQSAPVQGCGVRGSRTMVRPISRDTTRAMYITPANCPSITSARACGNTGTTSLRPTPDNRLKLRYISSIQLRCSPGEVETKLPGSAIWHTEKAKANAHASRVKVA